MADHGEAMGKLSLSYQTLEAAVVGITELLNLAACEGSETVPSGATSHDLLLAGAVVGGTPVLVRCMAVMSPKLGCLAKVRAFLPQINLISFRFSAYRRTNSFLNEY